MLTTSQKEFIKLFDQLSIHRNRGEVWADLMSVIACTISNSIESNQTVLADKENEYEERIKRLGGVENPAKAFAMIVNALDENSKQDFLGEIFMELGLANERNGQIFTPYGVAEMMSQMTVQDAIKNIKDKGWTSVADETCRSGVMLIAAANYLKDQGINYQQHVLIVGQDVDRTIGQMAYIQLSLLGCAGYIVIGNTLTHPIAGSSPLFPVFNEHHEVWYMPMFTNKIWTYRRLFNMLA